MWNPSTREAIPNQAEPLGSRPYRQVLPDGRIWRAPPCPPPSPPSPHTSMTVPDAVGDLDWLDWADYESAHGTNAGALLVFSAAGSFSTPRAVVRRRHARCSQLSSLPRLL